MTRVSICETLALLFSIIFAVIVAVLFALLPIPNITTAIIINLILATILLILYSALLGFIQYTGNIKIRLCFRFTSTLFFIGVIGSIIASIIALSITLTPNVLGVILVGFIAFFFLLMLITFVCLLNCLATTKSICCHDKKPGEKGPIWSEHKSPEHKGSVE